MKMILLDDGIYKIKKTTRTERSTRDMRGNAWEMNNLTIMNDGG